MLTYSGSPRWIKAAATIVLLTIGAADAQDTVFLRNGGIRPGTVRVLGAKRVDFDESTGTDTLRRSKDLRLVRHIRFADGRSWPEPVELRRARQREIVALRRQKLNASRT